MASSKKKLAELAELFERTGSDPDRLAAVRQTQAFRRSWVDLAKLLRELKSKGKAQAWGFSDFYAYCSKELTLKRATVDKLLLSYSTLHRYAPKVLERDGVLRPLPSLESVNYMSKASKLADAPEDAANQGEDRAPALQALSKAVFEEQRPLKDIKREFNPMLFPKDASDTPKKRVQRSQSCIRRLKDELLALDMLPAKLRAQLDETLTQVQEELTEWSADQSAPKRSKKPDAELV